MHEHNDIRDEINEIIQSLAGLENHSGHIYAFIRGDGQLYVPIHESIDSPVSLFYLHFVMVRYYEGPTSWIGANFRLGTREEWDVVIDKDPFKPQDWDREMFDKLYDHQFLFVLDRPRYRVQIMAGGCTREAGKPPFHIVGDI